MAVAIVQQQQQPTDKITIDLANSKVVVNKDNKETPPNKKVEKKAETVGNTDNNTETKNTSQKNSKDNNSRNNKVKKETKVNKKVKDTSEKARKSKIKKEVAAQKPVMETMQLPMPRQTMFFSFAVSPYDLNGYASKVNKNLYEYEKVKSNQSSAMEEAIRLHNGDPSNTCVFFQSACLRAIGQSVPNHIGYTSVLWNWLENNNWEMHRDFGNIQKGDIIFAGEYHTMCFMGWKDKARGIAYVMGNEAYREGDSYSNRNMNGQKEAEENGWNNQFRATRYYKYKGTQIKGDSNSDITNMSNVTYNSDYHKFTVTPLKGDLTAKQDVYINEKPYPTYEEVTPIGLARGGEKFKVTGKTSNGWFEVTYEGKKGYISSKYANFIEDKSASKDTTVKPVKPTTPTKPEKPDKTTGDKSKPVEPNKSTDKTSPSKPEKPTKPENPKDTSKGEVTKPTDQKDKNKPNKPVTPEKPSTTTDNKKPVEPKKPVTPSKPAKPSKPVEKIVKTAYVKANGGLWLHSSMSTSSSSRMSLMNNGSKVTILGEDGSWFKVNYNGKDGWCAKTYLSSITENKIIETKPVEPSKPVVKPTKPSEPVKPTEPSKPSESIVKTSYIEANGGLWLHSTMSSSISSRLNIMDKNSKVIILEENGSWYKVNYNGKTGWCASRYLSTPKAISTPNTKPTEPSKPVKPVEPTKPNKPVEPAKPVKPTEPSESVIKTAHIKANGGLWLHSTMDSSVSSRLTIMKNGENVQILDENGSWFKVNYNGNMGWCSSKFLSEPVKNNSTKENKPANEIKPNKPANTNNTSSESSEKIAYVKANGGLWLHSTMSSSASSRMTIMGNGNKVTILSENGSWFKVNYNGNIGWCAKEFLTTPKTSQVKINTPAPTKEADFKIASIKANGGLWLHSNPSASALSRITIMGRGDDVKILGQSGSWYKVDYNGHIGWCSSEFIV